MSKFKKGQVVFLVDKQTQDAICEHCKSHYKKSAGSKSVAYIITLVSHDKYIKETYGEPLYHLTHDDVRDASYKYKCLHTSQFEGSMFETEEEALVAITKDNS